MREPPRVEVVPRLQRRECIGGDHPSLHQGPTDEAVLAAGGPSHSRMRAWRLVRVRHHGAPVFLGLETMPDGTRAPVWSADPERVARWLASLDSHAGSLR